MFFTTTNTILISIGASDITIIPLVSRIFLASLSFLFTLPIYLYFKSVSEKGIFKALLETLVMTLVISLIPEMFKIIIWLYNLA